MTEPNEKPREPESTKQPRIEFPRRHYIRLLKTFAANPKFVPVDESDIRLTMELQKEGYLSGKALHVIATPPVKFINPDITVSGRLFLEHLEKLKKDASLLGIIKNHILEIFTVVLAVATVILAWGTVRLANETHWMAQDAHESAATQVRVNTWLDMEKRMDGDEMKRARIKLAGQMEHYGATDTNLNDQIDETVMEMFDDMGSLYRRNLIDRDLTDGQFGWSAIRWWLACKDYVYRQREFTGYKDYYEDFENMATDLQKTNPNVSDAEVKTFLYDEKSLVVYDLPAEPPARTHAK